MVSFSMTLCDPCRGVPISCHFRGCKAPLSSIVSGAVSSELPLSLPSWLNMKLQTSHKLRSSSSATPLTPVNWTDVTLAASKDITYSNFYSETLSATSVQCVFWTAKLLIRIRLFIVRHVYEHSSEVWIYVISATLKILQ